MVGQPYFISVHVNGSTIVGVTYFPGEGESYLVGNISGDIGYITYASDLSQFDATFTFTSNTTATLTINNCVPGGSCLLPTGATVNAIKIF